MQILLRGGLKLMLYDMHPDVTQIVWKYGRWHHFVNYSIFKKNKLIFKNTVDISSISKVNNYGMKLVTNFTGGISSPS